MSGLEGSAESCPSTLILSPATSSNSKSASPPAKEYSQIGRLKPVNEAAIHAFHEVAQLWKEGKLCEHHGQYIVVEPYDSNVKVSSSWSDTASSDDMNPANNLPLKPLHSGYYTLTLRCEPEYPPIGYRTGKGTSRVATENRNVEFLLVAPGSKHRKSVASNHAIIRFHTRSGILMLETRLQCQDTVCVHIAENSVAPHTERKALAWPTNVVKLGGLQYSFDYAIGSVQSEYIIERNDFLLQLGFNPPNARIPPYFHSHDRSFANGIIASKILGAGSFAMVSSGVNGWTGEPVAVKQIWIKSTRQLLEVDREIDVAEFCKSLKVSTRSAPVCKSNPCALRTPRGSCNLWTG